MIKNHQENFITVMGIDPGLATTGYGIIRSNGREHEVLKAHYLKTSPKVDHFERLHYIFTEIINYSFGSKALQSRLFQPILISLPSLISILFELFGTLRIKSLLPNRSTLNLVWSPW